MEYSDDEVVSIKDLVELYESVSWMRYAADPDALARAVDRSDYVATAREDGQLVGLARCLTDDVSILYLQEILVRPSHHRQGIGSVLVERCLSTYSHVRQKVLLTDDEPVQNAFSESLGFGNLKGAKQLDSDTAVRHSSPQTN